jgi:hypothetical protein
MLGLGPWLIGALPHTGCDCAQHVTRGTGRRRNSNAAGNSHWTFVSATESPSNMRCRRRGFQRNCGLKS